jgi:hypothetical protein
MRERRKISENKEEHFRFFPAPRAAGLNPIDALRHE